MIAAIVFMMTVCVLSGCGKNYDPSIVEKFPIEMSKMDFLEKAGKEFKEEDLIYCGDGIREEIAIEDIEYARLITYNNQQFWGYDGQLSFVFEMHDEYFNDLNVLKSISFSTDTPNKKDYDKFKKKLIKLFGEPIEENSTRGVFSINTVWEQEDYDIELDWAISDNLDDPGTKLTSIFLYFY